LIKERLWPESVQLRKPLFCLQDWLQEDPSLQSADMDAVTRQPEVNR
jgi:hypothetical protein